MYNDPSAKDLLAMYPRQYADGGAVNDPVQSFQAPAVVQQKPKLTPLYAPGQVPAGYTGNYIDPTKLSASQQNARTMSAQDKIIRNAIAQTGLDSFGGRDYRQLQQATRRGDINAQNIKQQFVDPAFEVRVKNAYAAIGRTGGVMPALQPTSKGVLDEASYKNVTQAEYDYWSNLLKQGKISGEDFQRSFLDKAANEIPAANLEAQRVYIDNARTALGLPALPVKPVASTGVYNPIGMGNIGNTATMYGNNSLGMFGNASLSKKPVAGVTPVDLSKKPTTQLFNQGGPVEKKSGESEVGSDSSAVDLEQWLLENSRAQVGPVDVQEVRSARGPGKYDTRISKNIDGLEAFADVDVGDKKLSQLGARFMGRGRIGNYEVQYVFDPETKQPVITGAVRKELSPTSDVSAEGVYVPQKDGKDYYNAGIRYTKRFEDGGEVTNENVRTLRSIDVTPEDRPVNKKQVGHPNEYADKLARFGRQGQEGFANMIGLGEEVKFANAIPEFYFSKDEQLDGRGDAMRHMLLQAQIAKKLGRTPAEIASFIHENLLTGGQSDEEQAMDKSNDALGMDIGLRSKDKADMAYQALQAIKAGEAKTIAKAKKPKKFEDGGEVSNEEVRTLKSIDVTPEDKPEKSRVKENLDAIMQGLKDEDVSAKDVALFINSFIPVTGDIQSAAEGYQAFKDKDYLGAGLGAVGALPLVPNITKYVKGIPYEGSKSIDKFLRDENIPFVTLPVDKKDMFSSTREYDVKDQIERRAGAEGRSRIFYHAGDAGIGGDTTARNMGGGRDTGHFGTGTYGVTDVDNIPRFYTDRRPLLALLSRPEANLLTGDTEKLDKVHRALRKVNRLAGSEKLLPKDKILRAMNDFEYRFELMDKDPELYEMLKLVEDAKYDLPGSFTSSPEKMIDAANEHIKARMGAGGSFRKERVQRDSASTRYMKGRGYDGINTRLAPELDNTTYGSVIYRKGKYAHGGEVSKFIKSKK